MLFHLYRDCYFLLIVIRLIPGIQQLGNGIMTIVGSIPNVKIVYDLFNQNPILIKNGTLNLNKFENKIQFRNISFKYPNAKMIFFKI